jgi:hypothetical protein
MLNLVEVSIWFRQRPSGVFEVLLDTFCVAKAAVLYEASGYQSGLIASIRDQIADRDPIAVMRRP